MEKFSEITAIIPAAGLGKRLRPHTFTLPKVLIPVAGKPILGYILDSLKEIGIKKIVFIIGYLGEKIEEFVEKNYTFESKFVEQKEFSGLGYAVNLAKRYANGPVLIILGDTVIEGNIVSYLKENCNWIGVKEVENPERFGIVVEGKDGWIEKLIEKPKDVISKKAIVGIYYLKNSGLLFDCLSEVISGNVKTKKEYQLTDGLQFMLNKGEKIKAVRIENWYDCGKVDTLLGTNRHLLKKLNPVIPRYLTGQVVIKEPVYIGKGVKISNCVIGPYVSVGNNAELENVIIEDSIINDEALIKNIILAHSIIGHSAVMVGRQQRINLGDNSEITIEGAQTDEM